MDVIEALKSWLEGSSRPAYADEERRAGRALESAARLREHFARQARHHENLAWSSLAFFLAAATAFVAAPRPFWDFLPDTPFVDRFVFACLAAFAAAAFAVVLRQLRLWSRASSLERALTAVETRWLEAPPAGADLRPTRLAAFGAGEVVVPRAVAREAQPPGGAPLGRGPWLAGALMIALMVLWACLAASRFARDWHCAYTDDPACYDSAPEQSAQQNL